MECGGHAAGRGVCIGDRVVGDLFLPNRRNTEVFADFLGKHGENFRMARHC